MNPFYSIDQKLLKMYTSIAKIYQEVTGKSKNSLVPLTYASSAGLAASATYLNWEDPLLLSFGAYLGFNAGLSAILSKNRMKLTENVEFNFENHFYPYFCPVAVIAGLSATVLGTIKSYNAVISKDQLENSLSFASYGLTLLSYSSAVYLERVDIDPPSGRTLLDRIKEALPKIPKLIPQPKPI